MKFSEKWLREWVNPDVPADALAEQLTMVFTGTMVVRGKGRAVVTSTGFPSWMMSTSDGVFTPGWSPYRSRSVQERSSGFQGPLPQECG